MHLIKRFYISSIVIIPQLLKNERYVASGLAIGSTLIETWKQAPSQVTTRIEER